MADGGFAGLFDVSTGIGVRAGLKNLMTWGLDRAQLRAPNTFNTLAWMHLSPSGQQARRWFQGSIIAVGTWLDWLAGQSKLPGILKEAVESTFQDMPGSFTHYFEAHRAEIHLPEGFEGPKTEEDVKALIKEFQTFLGGEISTDLPGFLSSVTQSRWSSAAQRFYKTLTNSGNEILVWLVLQYFNDLSDPDKDDFLKALEFFDEPKELQLFMDAGLEGRRRMLDMAVRLKKMELLPTIARWYRENRPKFDEMADRIYKATGDQIGTWADSMEAENQIRRLEIANRRAAYVKPKRSWFPMWARIVVGLPLVFALAALLTLKGCEMSSNSRKAKEARIATNAQRDSLDEVRRAMNAAKERYDYLADSLARTPSGFVGDSASTRRQ